MIAIHALPAVVKARARCRTPGVVAAFDALTERLRHHPVPGPPDKRVVWQQTWPNYPNHRHADLPSAWRACWTFRRNGTDERVIMLFLGTHKEYERLYGFTTQ